MLHFRINRTTETPVKKFDLSSDWKITISQGAVTIQRNDASNEVHISGKLVLNMTECGQFSPILQPEQVFSRFMKAGSSFEFIRYKMRSHRLYFPGARVSWSLHGDLIICNVTQNRLTECKKCVHMKSVFELSNQLEGMLDTQTCCFADVQLKCGSESIPTHKNILSTRSSVFAAMFKNSMKESLKNEVEINDINESVFKIMLTYIYTGKTLDLTVVLAPELMFAADKYQLQDLKRVCCDFLKDNLSLKNVLSILVLGDQHSANELKKSAINYICKECKKFSDLEETEEWKTILKERFALAMEILINVVKSKDEKK